MELNIKEPKSIDEIVSKVKYFPSVHGMEYNLKSRPKNTVKNMAKKLLKGKGVTKVRKFDFSVAILGWDGEDIFFITNGVSAHRAEVIIDAIRYGGYKDIDPDIRENYVNNGYTTRIGLYRANEIEAKKKRCEQIRVSHMLCDTKGKEGHEIRKKIRNKYV